MIPKAPPLNLQFIGIIDNVRCELNSKLICSEDSLCNIMHEKISDIEVDPSLPLNWPIHLNDSQEQFHYNEIILPCKHTFHISCLIVHFQANTMRCPVCRGGYSCKLIPEQKNLHLELPRNFANKNRNKIKELITTYAQYLDSYTSRNPPSPTVSPHVSTVNLVAIRQEFYLIAQFDDGSAQHPVQHTSQITSRLILPESSNSDILNITLQYSFVRHLGKQIFSLNNPTAFNRLFCVIRHPCIPEGIKTANLRFSQPNKVTTSWPNMALIHSDVLSALEYEILCLDMEIPMLCDLMIEDLHVGELNFCFKKHLNDYKLINFQIKLNVEIIMQVVLAHVEHVVHMITSALEH